MLQDWSTIMSTFASRTLKASSFMNLFIQCTDRAFVYIVNNCLFLSQFLTNLTSLKLIVFWIYSNPLCPSFIRTRLYIVETLILILYTTIRFVLYLVSSRSRKTARYFHIVPSSIYVASNFLLITRILCWVRRVDVTKVSHGTRPLNIFCRLLGNNFVARKVKCRGWRTTVPETLCHGS